MATPQAPEPTPRLRLRTASRTDAALFARLLTDPMVREHLGGPLAGARLAERLARIESPGVFVVELGDGTPIGSVAIGRRPTGERELSYELLPEHWGNGYAQEACGSVLAWALANASEDGRVVAVTQVTNGASLALLARLGLREVGRFEEWGEPQVMLATERRRDEPQPYDPPVTAAPPAIVEELAATGRLRASINLGNPVLAQGTHAEPAGVTVDIARELAARLGVPVELVCFDAARASYAAMGEGRADICFLAVDPAREAEIAFTAPYVVIEGVYVVARGSELRTPADVDRPGVRIGVKQGSAYDLFLTRALEHASVVRGDEGVEVFRALGLEVGAGIRQPVEAFAAVDPGVRVLPERFMEISQALGTTRSRSPETVQYLHGFVEELKASGFVADSLRRSGRLDATVAPPAA